jgi:hypothetical protein
MATYAPTLYTGAEDTYAYLILFPYARATDVRVYVDGSLDTNWYFSVAGTKVTWDDGEEPQDDTAIRIARVTDISDAATVFTSGSGFVQVDINTVLNQLLYAIDELQVPAYDSGFLSCATLVDGGADIEYLHGLGAVPTRVLIQYKCTDTEAGYETGDVITQGEVLIGGVFPCSTTAFTATFETMDDLRGFNVTTGVAATFDDTKWSYRILAWR